MQNEQYEKEMEIKKKKREEALCHRQELLSQINEKERERITKLQEKFKEGNAMRLEQQIHEHQLKEYVKQKIENLRYHEVFLNYFQQLKRRVVAGKMCLKFT